MKKYISFLFALLLTVQSAWALDPFYKDSGNVAASGYDVVAYFTLNRDVQGDENIKATYDGADFYFSSEENKKLFVANPKKYAPQFGGYCAFAAGKGYVAKSVPEAFTIHNGKLYLNYSLSVRERWNKDRNNLIRQGEKNWPDLLKNN